MPSHTVIGNKAPKWNCPIRCTLLLLSLWFYILQGLASAQWKSSESIANCGVNFFIVVFHFLLVKAAMDSPCLWKLRKRLFYCICICKKFPMNFHLRHLICNLKTRRRCKTLKGSLRMEGQAKFAANLHASLFNKDLSNETTFSLISHWTVPLNLSAWELKLTSSFSQKLMSPAALL